MSILAKLLFEDPFILECRKQELKSLEKKKVIKSGPTDNFSVTLNRPNFKMFIP